MHEAILSKQLSGGKVQCLLCPHECVLAGGETGNCRVRFNQDSVLYTRNYGRAASLNVDPIEKKPLYHFLPGSLSLSLGTYGCNLHCPFCQNWEISQQDGLDSSPGVELTPRAVIGHCLRHGYSSISYTYNEPTVFIEYALDIAKPAREAGIRNVFVSNGYMGNPAVKLVATVADAINIDLKGPSDEYYRKHCRGGLSPVLNCIEAMHGSGVWVEVTSLIIPGLNDDDDSLASLARMIAAIDRSIPWHVTAFHPDYKMTDRPLTDRPALLSAWNHGHDQGLKFVYTGNIVDPDHSQTNCPACSNNLINRNWHNARITSFSDGRCLKCGEPIPGVWI